MPARPRPLPRVNLAPMWVLDRLLAWVERVAGRLRKGRAGKGERALASLMPGSGMGWPGGWSQARFEQVQHFKGWTYVAVKKRAETIAGLAPHVARVKPTTARPDDLESRALRQRRQKALTLLEDDEELDTVALDHPLRLLLRNPNGPDTAWSFWYKWSMNLDLTGNAYLWAVPNGLGAPAELWVLPSQWVYPVTTGRGRGLVEYFEVRPYGGQSGRGGVRLP